MNNKVVTKVKVSSKGTFSVKLSKVSKGNNKITLQAIVKAGIKVAAEGEVVLDEARAKFEEADVELNKVLKKVGLAESKKKSSVQSDDFFI
nr:hypothetical protein [Paenisporosarcina sp. OV554]